MGKLPLSVAIITHNEEERIGRTLEAVKDIASEIVVVDSHSTDRTRDIAKSYGAKVYEEDWKGYSGQKNSALEKCSQEWVLFLDADEVVSEELKRSIAEELTEPSADAYMMNRKTYYMGKLLNHVWQPEWRLRLVRRNVSPLWVGEIHEDLQVSTQKVGRLRGDLYHYSYRSFTDHMEKLIKFSSASAKVMHQQGKKSGFSKILLRPVFAFLRSYVIKKGFLDGYPGLIAATTSFVYTFCKYAFLYEMSLSNCKNRRRISDEDSRN